MSYAALESSRQSGTPISLYLFVWGEGPTAYYAYTDADEPVPFEGKTYQPVPIGRAGISAKGGLDKTTLEIDTTPNTEIARLFAERPPSFPVTLVIRQGHLGDGDFKVVFSGRVVGWSQEGPLARIVCEPFATLMRNPGLRRNWQYGCPHVLYDGSTCRADPNAVKQTVSVASVGKFTVALPPGWNGPIASDKFLGGYAQWTDPEGNTQVRTIVALEGGGTTARLARKVTGLSVSDSIDLLPGCNHQTSDCEALHVEVGTGNSNIVNYGGQKDIPLENPMSFARNFYY